MKKELDSLYENKTQTLISKYKIKSSYLSLGRKQIYNIKYDVKGKISRFKTR